MLGLEGQGWAEGVGVGKRHSGEGGGDKVLKA